MNKDNKNENLNDHFDENGYYICDNNDPIIIPMNFINKLHQSKFITKKYYSILKNELLSYNTISEITDEFETFKLFDLSIANIAIYKGILKIRLEFNKKKAIKKFKEEISNFDNILISNGYLEMYVDDDITLNRAIDLIGVLMRDLHTMKDPNYENYDYTKDYATIENSTFREKEKNTKTPELVVKSSIDILNNIKMYLIILVGLIVLTGITTCFIYKANLKDKHPVFDVLDDEGNVFLDSWTFNEEVDIFNDPNLGGKKIIYPGRTSTFYFYVANTNDYPFKCNLSFSDLNEENINMRYRLRIANASFENAPWQEISEINVNGLRVEAGSKVLCALDWTWLESDKDTEIGEKGSASYSLSIHFSDFEKID